MSPPFARLLLSRGRAPKTFQGLKRGLREQGLRIRDEEDAMPQEDDPRTESKSSASSLTAPLIAVGAFAAGAAATLLAKRLIGRRDEGGSEGSVAARPDDGSNEDLATVLRRAALDVAVLASGQAAERLRSRDEAADAEAAQSSR
jgi:hypothetical protein